MMALTAYERREATRARMLLVEACGHMINCHGVGDLLSDISNVMAHLDQMVEESMQTELAFRRAAQEGADDV